MVQGFSSPEVFSLDQATECGGSLYMVVMSGSRYCPKP